MRARALELPSFVLALVLVSAWSSAAMAHGLRPGVLALTEERPGSFVIAWSEPVDTSGSGAPVEVVFPAPCRREGERLECGTQGLRGTIAFQGLAEGHDRVMTLVRFHDGRVLEHMVTVAEPRLVVDATPGRSASAWLGLGLHHIMGGLDHVAFVLGLMLVVGATSLRRLVTTITAFTLAHSLTLALAVTGILTLASAPVEATIAASVVLVAREATHHGLTLTRRSPWVVALLFGLVHGLGFAGALREQGLPEGWVGRSLLWFNLGVELGQLAIVAAVVAAATLGRRFVRWPGLRTVAAYALGGLGAWWFLARAVALVWP
ncbi:HupE/UreJ family protein [Paraliomyxa miuraensis]|uniref:HupE/UreJ family protein n=1 Tax=Paraliomyxa miuraensis TaxID=376150 RepID=UPI002258CFFC|nr:HupE/UreJ family protein [Paraliomyxa miuraensis]MCX4247917.1 HupE/UreJ family protein [Paraliomyxa miuraensis]